MPWFGIILPKSCDKEPNYLFVWDILILLNFMKGMENNEKCTLKLINLKLATPIALLSLGRTSEFLIIARDLFNHRRRFIINPLTANVPII